MPGPLPNPARPASRHRTAARPGLVDLPADGCDLPIPPIPTGSRKWTAAERKLWRELWQSPQATQWDDSYCIAVAVYIAHSSAILSENASAWHAQEFRHLGDKLGLTPAGMASLGWRIVDERPDAAVIPLPGGAS